MARAFTKETELGPPVVEWLTCEGFDVYQEVPVGGGAIDVVGVRGPLVVAVELKLSASWELLDQARGRRWCDHMVWAAVPYPKGGFRHVVTDTFAHHGVGLLYVRHDSWRGARVEPSTARPAFNRHAGVDYVRRALHEDNKTLAKAGVPGGGREWTEFKRTCQRVREYLASHPGASLREVVLDIPHHYASDAGARSRLVALIKKGVVKGVRVELDGRTPRLYLTGE